METHIQIQLTPKQKEVLMDMRAGTEYYFNPVTDYQPYTKGGFGMGAAKVHGKIMISLEIFELVTKVTTNRIVRKYVLTQAGKTISIS